MSSVARCDDCIGLFVRDDVYLPKLMTIVDNIQNEEAVANCLKIFRIAL
jgi:hypothetical protein